MESAYGKNLTHFFQQWINQQGAPLLELTNAIVEPAEGTYRIHLTLAQKQSAPLFAMTVPVAVWRKGTDSPEILSINLQGESSQTQTVIVNTKPQAVLIDPYHDVFRRLDRREVPPSIGQTYGAASAVAHLPKKDSLLAGYKTFSASLGENIKFISGGDSLPANRTVWLFGKDHPLAQKLLPYLKQRDVIISRKGITIEGKTFPFADHSFMFTLPHPENPAHSITWIVAGSAPAVPGLIRKLPHYGKYGFLVFEGDAPTNRLKGTWPAERGGLMKTFQPGDYKIPPRASFMTAKP